MTKTRLILAGSFLVAFAAGVSAGALTWRLRSRPAEHSWLASQLNLTADQREQMRRIWSEEMAGSGRHGDQRAALIQERDQAVVALLTEDQKPEYEAILAQYARKMEELSQERQRAFERAREKTRAILSPEQARKYDEFFKDRHERAGNGQRGGRRPPWPGGRTPQTRATTEQDTPQGEE